MKAALVESSGEVDLVASSDVLRLVIANFSSATNEMSGIQEWFTGEVHWVGTVCSGSSTVKQGGSQTERQE